MKSVVRILGIAAICVLTLGACQKDKIDYADGDKQSTENVGYLSFAEFEATVMEDTENITTSPKTRAEGVDINNFDVIVKSSTGEVKASFKYGQRPTEPLALDAGVYSVALSSGAMQGAAWEAPIYGAEKEFVVTRKQTTDVRDIVCKLSNIKVTVGYSADLAEQLDTQYTKMTVELEQSHLEYLYDETRAGYFAPVASENTLKLTFNCRYVGSDKDIVMTNEISGVKAAQWRKINVVVQHAAEGGVNIGIVCDTWTFDEEVTFDTSTSMMEVGIPDNTDVPIINWEGHDLTQPFELTDDMYDADGNFTSSINIDVTAKNPLKSLVVKVGSDNSDFTKAYGEIMPLEVDLCNTTTPSAILGLMGYPTNVAGATSTRIKLAAQASMFKGNEGSFNYEITAVDQLGAATTETLVIRYGQNVEPKIVWVGYDIKQQHTVIANETTCMIRVTAPAKIDEFIVEIVSEAITDDMLALAGLTRRFSLVTATEVDAQGNDTGVNVAEGLKNFGFPTLDEVYGQTLITEEQLNITSFLELLAMLGPAEHEFVMSVTDMAGCTTVERIQLRIAE